MNLLLDENIDRLIVEWLLSCGHDAAWICDIAPSIDDPDVLDLGIRLGRPVVTFDVRIGRLVLERATNPPGVAVLRLHSRTSGELLVKFQSIWPTVEQTLVDHLVSATADRVRARPLR